MSVDQCTDGPVPVVEGGCEDAVCAWGLGVADAGPDPVCCFCAETVVCDVEMGVGPGVLGPSTGSTPGRTFSRPATFVERFAPRFSPRPTLRAVGAGPWVFENALFEGVDEKPLELPASRFVLVFEVVEVTGRGNCG